MLCTAISAGAVAWFAARGYLLYYGDAQAHINIARRMWDSRTPGLDQMGTVWLPLPHLAMLPFVANNEWWRSGLAGAFPSAAFFVLGCVFLFGAARTVFDSRTSAWVAVLIAALNPNLLYLQSIPMTEAMFFGCFMALLFFTVQFGRKPSLWFAVGAGVAALAGSLTRYEGWFVIPFAALFFLVAGLLAGRGNRLAATGVFLAIALAGPLAWLAHNRYYWGDFLEFYHGPSSAHAIQGDVPYPGRGDWPQAIAQFQAAAALCAGWPLLILGAAGGVAALSRKRAIWPLILLALPVCFYVMSIHSGGTPIFVPNLPPKSHYNTRYGLALLPLAAFAAAALSAVSPRRLEPWIARIVIALAVGPWVYYHNPQDWITWKESEVNSQARRAWTAQAAAYLKENYSPGTGIFTTFGDVTGAFAEAGISLRDTLTWDNSPGWMVTVARPQLFLRDEWAVAIAGDKVQSTLLRAQLTGPRYTLQRIIIVKGAPVVEIYRRDSHHGVRDENPIYEGARREE